MEEVVGKGVLGESGGHRTYYGKVVHTLGDVREGVADRDAGLAVFFEFPRTGEDGAVVVELGRLDIEQLRRILAIELVEHRLGVEGVDLGRPPSM